MTCTFFGHRDCPEILKKEIYDAVIYLIEYENVDLFLVGNQGRFDSLAGKVLETIKKNYKIKYSVVLAYLPVKNNIPENSVFPEGLENVPPKYAIYNRNIWMINNSDFVVTYVRHSTGNSYYLKQYAEKKNKKLIEL